MMDQFEELQSVDVQNYNQVSAAVVIAAANTNINPVVKVKGVDFVTKAMVYQYIKRSPQGLSFNQICTSRFACGAGNTLRQRQKAILVHLINLFKMKAIVKKATDGDPIYIVVK